jgi:phage-related protein
MSVIRIVQYFKLVVAGAGETHRYQNYFIDKEPIVFDGARYSFVPFRAEGSTANLNGDNGTVQVLFPATPVSIRLVEQADGNRLTRLTLTTQWLNANLLPQQGRTIEERYVGIGASFSETTVELRFRTAMDSVGAQFPSRTLTRGLVGPLPINADLVLR